MIIGTLIHVVVGLCIYGVTKWTPPAISMLFLFKEMGEAKYLLPGSIWSLEKPLKMMGHVFQPEVGVQWIAPGVAVYLARVLQRKYGKTAATKT